MFQVTFSDQSIEELNKLDKLSQMQILESFSSIRSEDLENPGESLGRLKRGNQTFYRLRSGEFRIYFEVKGHTLLSHYILSQHSMADLVFRLKLPMSEDTLIEQHQSFWKYLESLRK